MKRLIITGYEDFEVRIGTLLGASDYFTIDQHQVNQFADATLDHQWIHTDPDRATKESTFGGPIAHGYLTISLVHYLWEQIIEVKNLKAMINYGIESLRFNQAVPVGASVKLHANLKSVINLRGITKVEIEAKMELKDHKKPVFTAILVFLYHFH